MRLKYVFNVKVQYTPQADTLEVLSDLRDVRQHLDMTAIERRNNLLMEKDKLVNQMIRSSEKVSSLCMTVVSSL